MRLGIGLVAVVAGALGAEVVVAGVRPLPLSLGNQLGLKHAAGAPAFRLDPEMGFCPIVPGPLYAETGTWRNSYSADKHADSQRVLSLGDSVTARGRIERALARRAAGQRTETPSLDCPRLEWWNGGVESFNTEQDVCFCVWLGNIMVLMHGFCECRKFLFILLKLSFLLF